MTDSSDKYASTKELSHAIQGVTHTLESLQSQCAQFSEELTEIKNNLHLISRFSAANDHVDIVCNGPFLNFMFMDDLSYRLLPDSAKHKAAMLYSAPDHL